MGKQLDDRNKAFKLHTQFELLKSVPVRMDVTNGNANEREVLASNLEPGRVYVMDRGYLTFDLFRKIVDVGSSLVCRVRENTAFEVLEHRPLSDEAVQAKIVRDVRVRFTGWKAAAPLGDHPMRIVEITSNPTTSTPPHDRLRRTRTRAQCKRRAEQYWVLLHLGDRKRLLQQAASS